MRSAAYTLFNGSVGRTDFPTGSMSRLIRSIKEKLMVLPDETKAYPGHEGSTEIFYTRKKTTRSCNGKPEENGRGREQMNAPGSAAVFKVT